MDTNRGQGLDTYHDEGTRLMRKLTEDDHDAFERLYDKYGSIIEQILENYNNHNMPPEDLIQEVFTRLWQQRMNFRGESRFLTYLYGIAKHTVSEEIRRSRKIVKRDLRARSDGNMCSYNDLSQPEVELFVQELRIILNEARAKLTAKERQALEVFHVGDVPLSQASHKLGCSHEALRSRLKRARKRSRELLDPDLMRGWSSNQVLLIEDNSESR